jgi:hypothetical protein
MKNLFCVVPLFLSFAQLASAQGVSAPWDISKTITALAGQAERLRPVLDQLTPEQWEAKGAPPAYTAQWRGARNESQSA